MTHKALYAGTFDPFTNGHADILSRGLKLFDQITLLVAVSPTKKPLLSTEQRVAMLEELYQGDKRVKVDSWGGLVVDYAKKNSITSIIRGLRPTGDFETEFQMASMNRKINPELDTVFLMTSERLYYISSTLVREVFSHGGDITSFVPESVHQKLLNLKD